MPMFPITDEHARKMAAEAVNASKAVGLGWLNHQPGMEVTVDDIHIVEGRIYIDYYQGRMVKFLAQKGEEGWHFPDNRLSPDYQSWCVKYPTWELLMEASVPL